MRPCCRASRSGFRQTRTFRYHGSQTSRTTCRAPACREAVRSHQDGFRCLDGQHVGGTSAGTSSTSGCCRGELAALVRLATRAWLTVTLQNFARSPDPDFPQALLLEQHQAPIAAALTPSFGTDSAPEVLASAIDVCAVFIGSGVVREVTRMGRILKLLTGALLRCSGT